MNKAETSRAILKGTAIFGGTQAVTMFLNLVKGKCVAILLGAYGMGISSLLSSAIAPLHQFFSFGMSVSAVSHISSAPDAVAMRRRIIAFRRGMTLAALLATAILLLLSPLLADATFGADGSATTWFLLASPSVGFLILASCESAVIQSQRALRAIALTTAAPALLGVLVSLPLFWLWGIRGIAPSLTLVALLTWVYARCKSRVVEAALPCAGRQTWRETYGVCRQIMSFGLLSMSASLIGALVVYLTNAVINHTGGTREVAFYQTTVTITTQFASILTYALSTDFFPQLSRSASDRASLLRLVNRYAHIMLLLAAPLTAVAVVAAPLIVRVLLTPEFDAIVPLLQVMSLTLYMRAFFYPLDYISMAKADKKLYFCVEILYCNLKNILIPIPAYLLWGISGLALGVAVATLLDMPVSYLAVRRRYGIVYSRAMLSHTLLFGILLLALVLSVLYAGSLLLSLPLLLIILALSLCTLRGKLRRTRGENGYSANA